MKWTKAILLFSVIFFLLFAGCKKDLLHFSKVQKIESYTTQDRLSRIIFVNDKLGYVVGGQRFDSCIILTTRDGGYTYNIASFPDAGKCLYGVAQSLSGATYAVGFDGKLLWSANGTDWTYRQMWFLPFNDIAFIDAQHGIGIGGVSFQSGFRFYIDTAGSKLQYDSLAYQLNRIKMADNETGYITGYGVVQKTSDGGKTWMILNVIGDNFTGIDVHSPTDVWICGYAGSVYHTTDGGKSWKSLRNGNDIKVPDFHLNDIYFQDDVNGWAVGENGIVLHTDDGGNHWMEYDNFTHNALRSIVPCPNGDLMVAGDNGALYRLALQ
ncbi:MAG: YCF48-related protein [Flavipsychrobacter sp.]